MWPHSRRDLRTARAAGRGEHALDASVTADDITDPSDLELQAFLFSTVQTLLLHAMKHSSAHGAPVRMTREGPNSMLVAEGAGGACDPDPLRRPGQSAGFSLLGTLERRIVIGGYTTVGTRPGTGWRIRLQAPIDSPAAAAERGDPGVSAEGSPSEDPQGDAKAEKARRPIRVMLVDDHSVILEGLARILAAEEGIEVVASANSGEQAIALLGEAEPDVVVMDITMPGMGGVEATQRLIRARPDIRVIGLSMHEQKDVAEAMVAAGAAGYVAKGGPAKELVEAIRGAGPRA